MRRRRYVVLRDTAIALPASSLEFVTNASDDHEHAALSQLPDGFGDGEFTFSLWVRCTVATFSAAADGSAAQLTNWMTFNDAPYSSSDWWFRGNFLLDGHNNTTFENGTNSLQFANGRVRWTFGDGAAAGARTGDLHGVVGTTNIVDGDWHKIECVRRWDGGTGSILELWIDGVVEDSETSTARTNMASTYWDSGFSGFPVNQRNWMFACEKQAATTVNLRTQYEDYKGLLSRVSFWSRAKTSTELTNDWQALEQGTETGLVGLYRFTEQTGSSAADTKGSGGNITLVNPAGGNFANMWNSAGPP